MEKEEKQNRSKLKTEYDDLADRYASEFSLKYLEGSEYYWVGDDIGGMIEICDYFFSYDTVRYCVDNDVSEEDLFSWFNYGVTLGSVDHRIKIPTLHEWVNGDKGIGPKKLAEIEEASRKVKLAEMALMELVDKYTDQKDPL